MAKQPKDKFPGVIRIDPDVWAKLKKLARPFENPNGVLRRLLKLKPKRYR